MQKHLPANEETDSYGCSISGNEETTSYGCSISGNEETTLFLIISGNEENARYGCSISGCRNFSLLTRKPQVMDVALSKNGEQRFEFFTMYSEYCSTLSAQDQECYSRKLTLSSVSIH